VQRILQCPAAEDTRGGFQGKQKGVLRKVEGSSERSGREF